MNKNATIVTFNAGSSSIKFGLYLISNENLSCMVQGGIFNLDTLNLDSRADDKPTTVKLVVIKQHGEKESALLPQVENHEQAIAYLLNWLQQHFPDTPISAVGHRVVHGGNEFTCSVKVDDDVLEKLHSYIQLAPLHMSHNLSPMETIKQQRPDILQVACFDTAFHHTMSWNEQHYALPQPWFDEGLRRYGFHGLSYEYIASVLPDHLTEQADARIIVAHLGHGASLCALYKRQSVATTMGFTPLSGIPMATRSGDIDPGIVSWLLRENGKSIDEIEDMLNHQSGLLGLSGISADMRVLLTDKSDVAKQAVDYFTHHTHRAIASLSATLGGLDALIFTAGIGENSAPIRQKVCQQARWLGLEIDKTANTENRTLLSPPDSKVSVWCIPTNEELMIARHTRALLQGHTI